MSDETNPRQAPNARLRTPRIGAVVAIAVAAAVVAFFLLRDNGTKRIPAPPAANATAASVGQLRSLATSVRHPIFWLGPKSGYTYELTKTADGKIYVRYLPAGVAVGSNKPYLTVATYPFTGAYAAMARAAAAKGAVKVKLAHGGVGVLDSKYPQSVHLAFPRVDYEIEVYDPTPARALQLVSAGQVDFFGRLTGTRTSRLTRPTAVSAAGLKSLAASIGHSIYWAGPMQQATYEVTQTSNGNVYVRYLPDGVRVGAKEPYLTVVTYPFPHALAALQRVAKGDRAGVFHLPGGGLAVVDATYPKSVHVAFPASDVQIEVFDPNPARARQIATSGVVVPIR